MERLKERVHRSHRSGRKHHVDDNGKGSSKGQGERRRSKSSGVQKGRRDSRSSDSQSENDLEVLKIDPFAIKESLSSSGQNSKDQEVIKNSKDQEVIKKSKDQG